MSKAYFITNLSISFRSGQVGCVCEASGACDPGDGGQIPYSRDAGEDLRRWFNQRCVVVEFESIEAAVAAYESEGYRAALSALGNGAERDIRVLEGA